MGTAASSILSASPSLLRRQSLSTRHHGLLRPHPYAGLRLPHRRLTGLLRLRRLWLGNGIRNGIRNALRHGHDGWLWTARTRSRLRHGHLRTLLLGRRPDATHPHEDMSAV